MNLRTTFLLLLSWQLCAFSLQGQTKQDSLIAQWQNESEQDTNRLEALSKFCWSVMFTRPDTAYLLSEDQLAFAKQGGYDFYKADALKNMGIAMYLRGMLPEAKQHYVDAGEAYQKAENRNGQASIFNNLAMIHNQLGEYDTAISLYSQACSVFVEIDSKKNLGNAMSNVANIYFKQGNFRKALDLYDKSLRVREQLKDTIGMAHNYVNLGDLRGSQGHHDKSLEYFYKAIDLYRAIGDSADVAMSYLNIGVTYLHLDSLGKAEYWIKRADALKEYHNNPVKKLSALNTLAVLHVQSGNYDTAKVIFEAILPVYENYGLVQTMSQIAFNLGRIAMKQGDLKTAKKYTLENLSIAETNKYIEQQQDATEQLYLIYRQEKDFESALEMHERFVTIHDSLRNESNKKKIIEQEFAFDYDKKEAVLKAEQAAKNQLAQATQARQLIIIIAISIILLLALLFGVFIYNRFKVTQQQKRKIEEQKQEVELQKEIIEEKNREITDSITYARRIQTAILPPDRLVRSVLPDSFVLYMPKDIVAGDFYWMEALTQKTAAGHDEWVVFAAADCTGHGVPGAMVSVVCHNALNRSVREFNLLLPGEILDKTRELVIETFQQSQEDVKDGMDISICALNLSNNKLLFAGANNGLYHIRQSELNEIKPDKQPIGKYDLPTPFTTHELQLEKGDVIFLFTDGFPDQFGGPNGKKYKYKPFKQFLLDRAAQPVDDIKSNLRAEFETWRGSQEQIDDVCIIGVRV